MVPFTWLSALGQGRSAGWSHHGAGDYGATVGQL